MVGSVLFHYILKGIQGRARTGLLSPATTGGACNGRGARLGGGIHGNVARGDGIEMSRTRLEDDSRSEDESSRRGSQLRDT